MKEMDPDGDGEVTLDEFQQWWSANISIASSGTVGSSSAQEEINELRIQLAEANEQLKRFESHKSTMKGPDPLGYVQSARSKLRTITPVRTVLERFILRFVSRCSIEGTHCKFIGRRGYAWSVED